MESRKYTIEKLEIVMDLEEAENVASSLTALTAAIDSVWSTSSRLSQLELLIDLRDAIAEAKDPRR